MNNFTDLDGDSEGVRNHLRYKLVKRVGLTWHLVNAGGDDLEIKIDPSDSFMKGLKVGEFLSIGISRVSEIESHARSLVDLIFPDFVGCDGKVLSDELLELQMKSAAEREDYEYAAKCREELNRRSSKK